MFGATDSKLKAAVCLILATVLAGCNIDGRWTRDRGPSESTESEALLAKSDAGVDISIIDVREVDLVETLISHRSQYHQLLEQLRSYYEANGYTSKADWASFELQGTHRVKQFRYLLDAEVPSQVLNPVDSIAEADALYAEAVKLLRSGGHGVPAIYRQDRMVEAARAFRELIERFPSSDKIDDAAFFCGEIHKEYLPGQEAIAVRWYERAWTWNPQTEHPARFQAATIHDFRLHDRDRALELYKSVLEDEAQHASNVRFSRKRIQELTAESG